MRRAQNHRAGEPSLGAVAQSRGVVHQLIDAGIDKAHKLDLADGLQPLRRHADAQPADQEFGKRRIEHALGSEALLQARGRAEDAAVDADILAEHDDIGIAPPSRVASARLTASTSVTSGIVLSREFTALCGIDLGQIGIEVIEHGFRSARCRCQIALDRRLDALMALGGELLLVCFAPHCLTNEISPQTRDRLFFPMSLDFVSAIDSVTRHPRSYGRRAGR